MNLKESNQANPEENSPTNTTPHTQRLARVQENDARLRTVGEINRILDDFPRQLHAAWQELEPLIRYYENDWISDFEALDGTPDGQYGLLSEDGVWNEMTSFHASLQEILEVTTAIKAAYENEDVQGILERN